MKVNVQKWFFATIAVFVFLSLIEFAIPRFIIKPWHSELFPPPTEENMMMFRIWSYLGRLIFSGLFVYIYTKGFQGRPGLGEGIRYGILIGVLIHVPAMFADLVTSGLPGDLLMVRMLISVAAVVIAGVIAGALYKSPPVPA